MTTVNKKPQQNHYDRNERKWPQNDAILPLNAAFLTTNIFFKFAIF